MYHKKATDMMDVLEVSVVGEDFPSSPFRAELLQLGSDDCPSPSNGSRQQEGPVRLPFDRQRTMPKKEINEVG